MRPAQTNGTTTQAVNARQAELAHAHLSASDITATTQAMSAARLIPKPPAGTEHQVDIAAIGQILFCARN
jgi:hypothetical protein